MEKAIILRYSEIHLKGNNRGFFENTLIENIKKALKGIGYNFTKTNGRYVISYYKADSEEDIIEKLQKVFGLHSLSVCFVTNSNLDDITQAALQLGVTRGTFKVECNRADKTFPMKSYDIAAELGGRLLDNYPELTVDIHNPQNIVYVDLRENKKTFVFTSSMHMAGGLPVGCGGKGLLLLSGGIDSPVAGYMMAKRGMKLSAIHFHSYPFTGVKAKEKVLALAQKLSHYTCGIKVSIVPFTDIQVKIHENCPEEFMITIMRRFMMRIAERLAKKTGASALITGESLGQVASQTIESINVTNSVVSMPVLRPLIGFDKEDIIKISYNIDTYETSILPYEDCCTVFLPKHPVIKPKKEIIERAESRLDIETLVETAVENIETIIY